MMKIKKFTTLLIFIFLLILSSCDLFTQPAIALECNCDTIYNDKIDVIPDNLGNFFIVSYDAKKNETIVSYFNATADNPCIKRLDIKESSDSISSIPYKYNTVNYSNNSLYISQLTDNNTSTILNKYTILNDQCIFTDYFKFSGITINSTQKIAIGKNDIIFIIKSPDSTYVSPYTISGEIANTKLEYNNDKIVSISTDISGNYLYALTNSYNLLKYDISSNEYRFSSNTIDDSLHSLYTNYKFLNNNTFICSFGTIYNLNQSKFEITSSCNITMKDYPSCVAIAGFDPLSLLAKTADNVIYRFNCEDGTATQKLTLDNEIIAISCSKDKTIVITKNNDTKNISLISESNFENITETPVNPDPTPSIPDSDINNVPNENPPSDIIDAEITSSINYIDYENFTISEINPGTTLAEFKNNLDYNGYNLSITDAAGKHKSGNKSKLGTGNIVTFLKDGNKVFSFTLIVKGDLTGTGTITSRDLSCMSNYLLGKNSLEGIYLQAADINNDGEINSIDLFLMQKMISG